MTTIIIVVVVALVFFVAVCVVTFMVWKRESELRTDSIKAIEENLEKLTSDLPQTEDGQHTDKSLQTGNLHNASNADTESVASDDAASGTLSEEPVKKSKRKRSKDPFGWVKEENRDQTTDDIVADDAVKDPDLSDRSENPQQGGEAAGDQIEGAEGMESVPEISSADQKDEEDQTELTGEIDLDFIDEIDKAIDENTASQDDLGEMSGIESETHGKMGYDVGKSGKKYTASELETLIKE